jgi:choline-sulfatase
VTSRLCSFAAALLLFGGCSADPPPDEPRPNIDPAALPMKYRDCNLVFISIDALQARHVGCLGNPRPTTPALDALAAKSFSFNNHISVASWTVPASMTWFTGVYPCEHHLTNKFSVYQPPVIQPANLQELSPRLVTLAQILKQNGYATAGFTGNAGVSRGFGYGQGFDEYIHEQGKFGGFQQSVPQALKWMRANRERKFFVFLHGYDAHGQSLPPGGYDYRFVESDYDYKYTGSVQEQETLREEGLENGRLSLRDGDIRFWRAIYDEKIQRADAKIGRFLRELEELGLTGNTLLVVTSDHGTELFEHGRIDHGFTLYNELLHVPLVVRLPGQQSGKLIADRVSSIDVMPTILDLLDVPIPEEAQPLRGSSLTAAMGGQPPGRDVFSETDYRQYTYQRSIIAPDGWKLIYTLESRSRELFDLNTDPAEQRNLVAANATRADALEARLFGHFQLLGHDLRMQRWDRGLNPVYDSQAK